MSEPIYKPVVHIDELGEQARLPAGGIINAGGVEGPTFSVGGKALIFADGTATDGSGQVVPVGTPGTGGGGNVTGYEWIQAVPADIWHIPHNKGSSRIQVTIWDPINEMIWSDTVKIVDPNTVVIIFNSPVSGRAILMLF